ncbi:hypothetical protein [Anabaena sp. CA = ATCC 33047]|uniref:hypothetical protein n=1 Tax=Anabaena sp. (strain CA / ATCC 33047) TaxID=52271 RepID=UPI00082C2FCA|nr:hypothetical protein [Anabaena sp. CA = ATCC 33047]
MFKAMTRLFGSRLWREWTFITLAGFLVGGILGVIGGFVGLPVIGYLLTIVVRGCQGQGAIACMIIGAALGAALGLGLSVGTAQWFILRRIVPRSQWWILASALGWCGIAFTLTVMLYTATSAPGSPDFGQPFWIRLPAAWGAIAQVTLAGALMGLFQWLILRATVRQSFWWIPANACIMLLAALGVFILGYNIGGLPGMGGFIVSFSPIYALFSGSVLNWLVQHSRNQTAS